MKPETYVIPRTSMDESTYATLVVEFTADAISRQENGIRQLKQRITDACTDWVKGTEAGKQAWENAGKAFNIGDLANEDLAPINQRLQQHGIRMMSLDVDSMDARPDQWVFDDVLVDEA